MINKIALNVNLSRKELAPQFFFPFAGRLGKPLFKLHQARLWMDYLPFLASPEHHAVQGQPWNSCLS